MSSSIAVVESTEGGDATTLITPTLPTPVQPSLTTPTLPGTSDDSPDVVSTTTRVVPASSTTGGGGGGGGAATSQTSATAAVPGQSATTRSTTTQAPSTSTSISVVLVTSVVTEGGSTFTRTSSSSSTSLLSSSSAEGGGTAGNSNSGSSGLSGTAKNAIIGSTVGVGGAIILGLLFFFIARYVKKRKSDYTPGEDDIRWPEESQDAGALFTPAVRQTGGSGLGREMSMRSTVAPSITTAGVAAYSSHGRPTTISESDNGYAENHSDHSGTGLAPVAAGYYDQQPRDHRYSYQPQQQNYGGYYQEPDYNHPQDRQSYAYNPGYEASIRSHSGPLRSTNHSNLDDVSEYGGR